MCQPGRPSPSMPDGRRPARLALLRGLPQHEIHLVLLVGGDVDARAGQHLVERAARQRAVARRLHLRVHALGRKQHVAFRDIGDVEIDQPLDHRLHLVDMFGGARLEGRLQAAQRLHVGLELRVGFFGDLADRLVERQAGIVARGARVDLVVDVGDVADIGDVVLAVEVPEQPEQHVEDDDRPRIADMGEVVDGRAADIHAHIVRIDGDKILLRPRQRVVEPQALRRFRHKLPLGLLAWALFCLSVKKAKTSGPARALANNANAANGKRRFHGVLYGAPLPLASSPAASEAFRFVTARQHQRQNDGYMPLLRWCCSRDSV